MMKKYKKTILFILQSVWLFLPLVVNTSHGAEQGKGSGISFTRVSEPVEGAFTILMPRGWRVQGGIFRVNPVQAGGPLNAIEAKCNLIFQNTRGSVYFRILPDIVYCHTGIGGGFFAPGTNYQGAEVRQIMDAPDFLRTLFTYLHPEASHVRILKINRLAGEIKSMNQAMAYTNSLLSQVGLASMTFQNDAAGGVFDYVEGGVNFREVLLTGITDMRAALTWKNTRTLVFRAPVEEFNQWRPIMDIMRFSLKFSPQWVIKESQGQRDRANMVLKVFDEIQKIDREIVRNTTINREEIMNDNFLVLTGQEEFINPHTKEVETDTNAYKYRWTTPGGDIYYTNQEDEDPNTFLHESGYKQTLIRKRMNE